MRNARLTRLALLTAMGLVLFLFESLIPRPLPWLKPGLAHVATLIALFMLGIPEALLVVVLRVIIGSLLLGSFFNPAFILSLGGGIAATLAMGIAYRFGPKVFSIFGISILGAAVHNFAQLWLVQILIVKQVEIFYLAPMMILSSLFTGFVVAFLANLLIQQAAMIFPTK